MGAAVGVVLIVGVAADPLFIGRRVLQRDFHFDRVELVVRVDVIDDLEDVDGRVEDILVAVQPRHVLGDTSLVEEVRLLADALVLEGDGEAAIEKRQLAHAVFERVVLERGVGEDLGVGPEGDLGAGMVGRAHVLQGGAGDAAIEFHHVGAAIAADLGAGELTESRDGLGPHAVQAGRRLVRLVVELATGPDDRQDDFEVGLLLVLVLVHRDAAAIVADGQAAVEVDGDVDGLAVAGEVLVDGVVHEFVDEVVQAAGGSVGDIVVGPLADVIAISQDLGVLGGVVVHGGAWGYGNVKTHRRPPFGEENGSPQRIAPEARTDIVCTP